MNVATCRTGSPVFSASSRATAATADQHRVIDGASSSAAWAVTAISLSVALGSVAATRRSANRKFKIARRAEVRGQSVEVLLGKYSDAIQQLKASCPELPSEYDDVKLLRFVIENPDPAPAAQNLKDVIAWRSGPGKPIVTKAAEAIAKAMAKGGWDNEPVYAAAPFSAKISKFLTPKQMVVVSTKGGDLVTCIQAGKIDSESMMKEVTEQELTEFFLYAREVNVAVAEMRTRATGKLCLLLAANDLMGVSSFPDKAFQNALTGSSKRAVTLYPGFSGPTMLLNLPWLARALVGLLTPLFPGAVRSKLKFARGPMAYLEDLTSVLKEPQKSIFIDDLEAVLAS